VLAPSQKYEMLVAVLTEQYTQREAAEKWRVDRCTVSTIYRTAKQGALNALPARPSRPGKTGEQSELEEARAEIERLRATVAEHAVILHLHGLGRQERDEVVEVTGEPEVVPSSVELRWRSGEHQAALT